MEISANIKNGYRLQPTQNRKIAEEGKIQAQGNCYNSLPSVSPAYYSPSFMAKGENVDETPLWRFFDIVGNCRDLGNTNIFGPMLNLNECSRQFGCWNFDTIIDLDYKSDKPYSRDNNKLSIHEWNDITSIGFNLDTYNWEYNVLAHPAFITRKSYEAFREQRLENLDSFKAIHRDTYEQDKAAIYDEYTNYDRDSREFIDDFTTVIQHMQKGNCYIGYNNNERNGTRCSMMLLLNSYFNPKSNSYTLEDHDISTPHGFSTAFYAYKMKNLYDKLTPKDKEKLGWDKEFDRNFIPRLYHDVRECGDDCFEEFNTLVSKK